MAKAYKVTSDPFYINANVTESAADTYTQVQISAPLDSLNREGLLIHAVYFTTSQPDSVPALQSIVECQVTSTSKANIVQANDANLLAYRESVIVGGAAEFSGPHIHDLVSNTDSYEPSMQLGKIGRAHV